MRLNGSDDRDVVGDKGLDRLMRFGSVNTFRRVEIDWAWKSEKPEKRNHIQSYAADTGEDKQWLANARLHSYRPFILRPVAVL